MKPCGLEPFFVGKLSITDSLPYYQKACSDFLLPHDSVFTVCMFLGIYPFFPGCPVCWHVHLFIVVFYDLILLLIPVFLWSVVTSSFSFIILFMWALSLFFIHKSSWKVMYLFIYSENNYPKFHWSFLLSFCPHFIYFHSNMLFVSLPLALDLVSPSFSSSLSYNVRLFIYSILFP